MGTAVCTAAPHRLRQLAATHKLNDTRFTSM
jgi:hypothetical protein